MITHKRHTSLLARISLPVFALVVTVIALFAASASYILIRVQNDHTRQMAEQSMKFVHRNLEYQLDTMNNMAAFLLSNQSIENLLETEHSAPYEAVNDFFTLQTNLQNLSLLSLLNDDNSGSIVQQTYVVAVALEPESGLYSLATDHFDPVTGIFKSTDLKNESWYRALIGGGRRNVWWGQKTGRSGAAMIYSATKKISTKDGRVIGTVLIGADTGSIRSLFENAAMTSGFHLLVDEEDRVIFSERYAFLQPAGELPFVRSAACDGSSADAKVEGTLHRVTCVKMDNGWKLLTAVPKSHFGRYTFAISAIGALAAIAAVLIAGLWLRRIVIRVTVPITRLVNAVQRPEVLAFREQLPKLKSGIHEVETLNEKFASMLVTLHGLIEKSFEEEIERRQLQLELLNAQINPHFLYNTLDLINCRAILAGDRETSSIVRSLANVFRFGLNRGRTWISLDNELKQVEAYLHIQQMMHDDLLAEFHIASDLQDIVIPHFILQPLAENAIVHGFAGRTDHCRIAISAHADGNRLILRVEDNGKGCNVEERNRVLREQEAGEHSLTSVPSAENGYGTLNVHRRIQLHCGSGYGLRYVHVVEGTCVEVVLPLRSHVQNDPEEESPDV
ncbi:MULTISPECIES: cache domain-containing sensor histidine kinase [Paenibacillus]|uniref:Two-component sensor kinase n=1 Tax=Paenibacillus albilobatus TaxID=2716884 RepID=A0A919XLK3_9BACL|nr:MULTISPECIES: sensor histidine kinase [Paenibacillus]GIO34441.1 putative two-component sensor kinase [Paenibacillus albilobatus]